jgi:calcium-dependent protein kinase
MLHGDGPTVVKLIDFGIAKQCLTSQQRMNTRSGTAYACAPEVLEGDYDQRVDIWALGIILHVLLVGYPPFWGENDWEIYKEIREAKLSFDGDEWRIISADAKNLVQSLIVKNPQERITMFDMMQHPWLNTPDSASPKLPIDLTAIRSYSQRLAF